MNYNALLLLDKHHKQKKDYSSSVLNNNQFTLNKEKYNKYINIRTKNKDKFHSMEKCYSVKPFSYMMPRDIILKDIFQQELKTYKNIIKYDYPSNNYNESNINRKQIFARIKKIIVDKKINSDIYIKTIYLYDLLCIKKENIENKFKNKFDKFKKATNILIALTAFLLILKFNYVENKMIRIKKIMESFDDIDITLKDLYEMEIFALKLVDYELTFKTPLSFMELFLINGFIFSEDYLQSDKSFMIYELAKETIENIMETSNEYFKYDYFYLCCSIICFVRDKFKVNKWPKALENNFGIKFEEFHDVYKIFFPKNNDKSENKQTSKNKVRSFYNSDIINIKNLKSINNIINVLKIMKSADKCKRVKEKINKNDLIPTHSNESKNENHHQYMNDNITTNSSSKNKIKVGLKKNWNISSFISPEKPSISKFSIPSMISKLNEESINRISALYMKSKEKKLSENKYNKEKECNKNNLTNSNSDEVSEKDEIKELETTNKFSLAKSYNKYKRNINIRERNSLMSNKSFINSCKSNLDTSYNLNQKQNISNIKLKNKEAKDNILSKSNINFYNNSNSNINNIYTKERRYKNFSKFTEKKINKDLINPELPKKQNNNNNPSYTTASKLNQTSYEGFQFYRHKPNIKQEISENNNNISKIKEENSNIPTCESSDTKIPLNDLSIRKTYRYKKLINEEKESKKIDKSKLYNKIKNTKIGGEDNPCSRKIGVRKFYKQKNLEENK